MNCKFFLRADHVDRPAETKEFIGNVGPQCPAARDQQIFFTGILHSLIIGQRPRLVKRCA